MPTHLFTYGTLMFPEIWDVVVGRPFNHIPAQAPNYQVFRVAGAVYPGIIATDSLQTSDLRPLTTSSVPGLLYLNLDEESLERLDAFEDDFYVRQPITVTCEDGRELEAEAYIVPPNSRHLLTTEPWTAHDFQQRGDLARFTSKYAGFNRLD